MKTLIMNNSSVLEHVGIIIDEIHALLNTLLQDQNSMLRLGTIEFEAIVEQDAGGARIAFYSPEAEQFYLESLVLPAGDGKRLWNTFRGWCGRLSAEGKANCPKLPLDVPNNGDWNCVIIYNACPQSLSDEEMGGIVNLQVQLATVYSKRINPPSDLN